MADVDVIMVNSTNGNQFKFRAVSSFKNDKLQPSIDIPLVNTTAANRAVFRFTGQQQNISFVFAIFNDGVDVSNSQNIITVDQQIQYLLNDFYTEDFNDLWTLQQDRHFPTPITGAIDNITIDNQAGAGTLLTGTLLFKRGRLGAV